MTILRNNLKDRADQIAAYARKLGMGGYAAQQLRAAVLEHLEAASTMPDIRPRCGVRASKIETSDEF